MINIKKYENLGHAQRVRKDPERGETETNSSKPAKTSYNKKLKIGGPPIKVKVVPPDELNSDEWWKKQNPKELYEIDDYDDEDDKEVLESDPRTYTTFEKTVTPFMKDALIKKPFRSPKGTQVHKSDEAWEKKRDDSPNKNYPEPMRLLPYPKSPRKRHRQSRTRTKGRGRGRSRNRSRNRSRRNRG